VGGDPGASLALLRGEAFLRLVFARSVVGPDMFNNPE
jgi:hypothetical protein